jgi:hypothetical protein
MLVSQEKYTENRMLQISLYENRDSAKSIVSSWKSLQRIYKKYSDTLEDIDDLESKILEKNSESDKEKKIDKEKIKMTLESQLIETLAQIKEQDATLNTSLENLTTESIISSKDIASENYDAAKINIKEAKVTKKVILRERSSIKKTINNATSYLTKLAKEAAKKAKDILTQNNEVTPTINNG